MRNALFFLLAFALCATPLAAAQADEPYQLVSVVMLMRHGVRAPGQDQARLTQFSPQTWPVWPAGPGELTAQGARNMQLLGRYLGQQYEEQGLLAPACAAQPQILVWSDNSDQRTRVSGQALIDGLLPGCHASASYARPVGRPDPAFHPVQTGVCSLDEQAVRQSVQARLADPQQTGPVALRPALLALGRILHPDQSKSALQQWAMQPFQISTGRDGHNLKIASPFGEAATVSEIFSLEYAQGLPASQVAWGHIASTDDLAVFMPLHNLKLSAVEQAPYVAARNGSMLAQHILDVLHTEEQHPGQTDRKLVILVGHDTNLANVAGLLGLHWHHARQPDDIAPGTALAFELLRNRRNGAWLVRSRLFMQTADQLRNAVPLDAAHPPIRQTLVIPDCQEKDKNGLCPFDSFARLLHRRIDRQCLPDAGPPEPCS